MLRSSHDPSVVHLGQLGRCPPPAHRALSREHPSAVPARSLAHQMAPPCQARAPCSDGGPPVRGDPVPGVGRVPSAWLTTCACAVSAGTCCDLRGHVCTPHNRGLNNKCFDDCMCAEGEPASPPGGGGRGKGGQGGHPSCSEAGSARSRDRISWRRWPEGPAAMEGSGENPLGPTPWARKASLGAFPICELIWAQFLVSFPRFAFLASQNTSWLDLPASGGGRRDLFK